MSRCLAEMMPTVTEPPRPNGLPIAITQSPTRMLLRGAERHLRQRLLRRHLQQRQVGLGVLADHLVDLELGAVVEVDDDLVGALDHVVVGDDDAFLAVDDEAGAQRGHLAVGRRAAALAVEEVLEELLERRALRHARQGHALGALRGLAGRDVDHRVDQLLGHRRDAGRAARVCELAGASISSSAAAPRPRAPAQAARRRAPMRAGRSASRRTRLGLHRPAHGQSLLSDAVAALDLPPASRRLSNSPHQPRTSQTITNPAATAAAPAVRNVVLGHLRRRRQQPEAQLRRRRPQQALDHHHETESQRRDRSSLRLGACVLFPERIGEVLEELAVRRQQHARIARPSCPARRPASSGRSRRSRDRG